MHCYLDRREGSPNWYIYQYDARTGQCQRFSTRTADSAAAEQKLAAHILKLPQAEFTTNVTLVQILLRYWEHHGQQIAARNTVRRIMGLIVEHEPDTRLYGWTIQHQKAFVAKISAKPGSQRRYMGVIRAAAQWHFDGGEIPSMPAIHRVKAEDGAGVRPYELEELAKLLEAAQSEHERLFLLLCVSAAPRPGAVLQLTWDRIDPKARVVDYNVPGAKRTKKRRALAPLAPTALAYLEANRSIGPVVQWNGKPMAGHKMTFARIARRAGVAGTAYGIRKAVSIWLRMEGVPEWDIKGLLGHAAGGVTERYAHYRPEYMRAAAGSVERLLWAICPSWLASHLPVAPAEVPRETQVPVAIGEDGGSCRARTCDQFLKRDQVLTCFQVPKAANED